MIVLAIDPGSAQSAWLVYNATTSRIRAFAIAANEVLLTQLRERPSEDVDVIVIEAMESYGMAVGREVFDTVWWSGRFAEAVDGRAPLVQLPRRAVKLALCGSARAKDANIRAALIDRFGGSAAKGTKASPGPLHGIANDVWSALAVAVTYADSQPTEDA